MKPVFRLSPTPAEVIGTVMSGDKIATRTVADFVAIDPLATKVTPRFERGDAPDHAGAGASGRLGSSPCR